MFGGHEIGGRSEYKRRRESVGCSRRLVGTKEDEQVLDDGVLLCFLFMCELVPKKLHICDSLDLETTHKSYVLYSAEQECTHPTWWVIEAS